MLTQFALCSPHLHDGNRTAFLGDDTAQPELLVDGPLPAHARLQPGVPHLRFTKITQLVLEAFSCTTAIPWGRQYEPIEHMKH